MTPEHQRVAIAGACGWRECWINQNGEPWGFLGAKNYSQPIPNYLNDLNAMHEAEKIIPRQLFHVDYWQKGYGRFQTLLAELTITPYSATATHRAEAFLRTIGKWEESK